MPVVRTEQLSVFLEIGWAKHSQAELMQANAFAMEKAEARTREMAAREVSGMWQDVARFCAMLEGKLMKRVARAAFSRWKQRSRFSELKVRDLYQYRRTSSIDNSPVRISSPQRPMYFGSTERKRHSSYDQALSKSPIYRATSPARASRYAALGQIVPRHRFEKPLPQPKTKKRSVGSTLSNRVASPVRPHSVDLEVERVAKRKLVSAALLLIAA